jgi:hypothetical protein
MSLLRHAVVEVVKVYRIDAEGFGEDRLDVLAKATALCDERNCVSVHATIVEQGVLAERALDETP